MKFRVEQCHHLGTSVFLHLSSWRAGQSRLVQSPVLWSAIIVPWVWLWCTPPGPFGTVAAFRSNVRVLEPTGAASCSRPSAFKFSRSHGASLCRGRPRQHTWLHNPRPSQTSIRWRHWAAGRAGVEHGEWITRRSTLTFTSTHFYLTTYFR